MTPLERIKAEIGTKRKRLNTIRRIQRSIEGEAATARYTLNRYSTITEKQRSRITDMRVEILSGERYFAILENGNPDKFDEVILQAGINGIKRAEQQLALYYINKHWAECLDTFDTVRRNIHFTVIGKLLTQRGPLEEYNSIVVDLCEKMSGNIKQDILSKMEALKITRDGIDMDEAGLRGRTTTWTYAVDESPFQFNALRGIAKEFWDSISGENGILTNHYRKKLDR